MIKTKTNKNKKLNKVNKTKFNKTKLIKTKFIKTKFKSIGGARGRLTDRFVTVRNSGAIFDEGKQKTSQCFWISIRDYLNMFRLNMFEHPNVSVGQIKRLVGLTESTDNQSMDYGTSIYKRAVDRLAELFDIRIEFYYIDSKTGNSVDTEYGAPVIVELVNDRSRNIVPIAHTTNHFELIISGPDLEPLSSLPPNPLMIQLYQQRGVNNTASQRGSQRASQRASQTASSKKVPPPVAPRPTIKSQTPSVIGPYTPKFLNPQTKEYVQLDEILDKDLKEILQSQQTIDDNNYIIKIYQSDIEKNKSDIKDVRQGIASLKTLGFSQTEEESLNSVYQEQIKTYTENISRLEKDIEKLMEERNNVQLVLNLKK